jgi:hypothetical protein
MENVDNRAESPTRAASAPVAIAAAAPEPAAPAAHVAHVAPVIFEPGSPSDASDDAHARQLAYSQLPNGARWDIPQEDPHEQFASWTQEQDVFHSLSELLIAPDQYPGFSAYRWNLRSMFYFYTIYHVRSNETLPQNVEKLVKQCVLAFETAAKRLCFDRIDSDAPVNLYDFFSLLADGERSLRASYAALAQPRSFHEYNEAVVAYARACRYSLWSMMIRIRHNSQALNPFIALPYSRRRLSRNMGRFIAKMRLDPYPWQQYLARVFPRNSYWVSRQIYEETLAHRRYNILNDIDVPNDLNRNLYHWQNILKEETIRILAPVFELWQVIMNDDDQAYLPNLPQ